jgi:1-aminocyclopropane-1-carboxylate deaminase/D-cysteine desulfhydrase-like pyridoxal-dependent ACC family enzyme
MKYSGLTPVEKMGNFYVKREDLAYWTSLEYPSGSKVRQYAEMAWHSSASPQKFLVGCSANSAMQIYVAATAKQRNTTGVVYTAKRAKRTEATEYAARMGAEIIEVKPGYLSYIRNQARERAKQIGQVVQWNSQAAIEDTIAQCENIPEDVKRIIVPTGSGLTAAAILVGVHKFDKWKGRQYPMTVAVCTSTMADTATILNRSYQYSGVKHLPMFHLLKPTSPYDQDAIAWLPDGTPLDPFYSAKAFKYLETGDLFWPVGLRPISSMPKECQEAFKEWKGPV